jgi:hypothetical protein
VVAVGEVPLGHGRFTSTGTRMQTLNDPFELVPVTQEPLAAMEAPDEKADRGARRLARPSGTNQVSGGDPWTRVRLWCSED